MSEEQLFRTDVFEHSEKTAQERQANNLTALAGLK